MTTLILIGVVALYAVCLLVLALAVYWRQS